MSMNQGQLLVLEMALKKVIELTKMSKNIGLKYRFAYDQDLISLECSSIKKIDNEPVEFKEFQNKRINLNIEYAIKDKDKKPLILNRQYQIDPNLLEEFTKKMNELEKEYKEVITLRTEQVQAYNKFLEEPVDDKIIQQFKKVKLSDLEKEKSLEDESIDLFTCLLPVLEE